VLVREELPEKERAEPAGRTSGQVKLCRYVGALTTVGLVAGGSLLATSVVLFVLGPKEKARPSTATACGGGPGTARIACHWTF
jgi:hypothetical protein